MNLRSARTAALIICALAVATASAEAQQTASAYDWLDEIARDLRQARASALDGRLDEARSTAVRAYLDRFELIEGYYGRGSRHEHAAVAAAVATGEASFHALLQSNDAAAFLANAHRVETQITRIREVVRASGVPITPETGAVTAVAHDVVPASVASTAEIRTLLQDLSDAEAAYRGGAAARALALVEHAYLERFEPLESRLPGELVGRIEKRIHLELRPAIRRNADTAVVAALIGGIGTDLIAADEFLADGGSAGFAIVNSFVIIVREGLEAVLLIAALLAYLSAIGAEARHRRHIYAGVGAGVLATVGTWFVARTLLPISGANRELLEGVTALLAVAVLIYVAHWLFQKTYIHDWKDYLRTRVGTAVTRGSTFALAALAFAAVYREGFETVLFYQALAFDAGVAPILGGFIPGMLLIIALGVAIIRIGLKLPLKKVFAVTNAILMYLALVFVGKGIYNLQEAGLFAPHPVALPDAPALRQLLGFYPLAETIAAQIVLLLVLAGTYAWYRRRASAQVLQSAPLPAPPASVQPAWRGIHRSPPAAPSGDLPRGRAP